jgi:hypothetical protein
VVRMKCSPDGDTRGGGLGLDQQRTYLSAHSAVHGAQVDTGPNTTNPVSRTQKHLSLWARESDV